MIRKSILLLALVGIMVSDLQAQSVASDHDTNTDFKKFKTYAWLAPGDSVLNRHRRDKLYGGYIVYSADKELAARGLKVDTLRPDAIFLFYTSVREITTYSQTAMLSVGVGVAGPGYYVSGSVPVAGGNIIETTEEDGVLKYAMYDTGTKKLVWSGMVEKTFSLTDDIEKIIGDYTIKIFKKYPVKAKK